MGVKIVRDKIEAWCRTHGVSGRWTRVPQHAVVPLLRQKLLEELGEYLGYPDGDPAELYDLLDVLYALIREEDPHQVLAIEHHEKVVTLGGFGVPGYYTQWDPVPTDEQYGGIGLVPGIIQEGSKPHPTGEYPPVQGKDNLMGPQGD
jgi:predicted house-cleaning noncanonical NTP pyrophosphatase (MazG superfamily)